MANARTHHRLVVLAAAALSAGLVVNGVVLANIPDAGGTIHGCYKKSSPNQGTLRVVDTERAQTCATNEVSLNWNETGPAGLQGPEGPQGPVGPEGPQGPAGPGAVGHTVTNNEFITVDGDAWVPYLTMFLDAGSWAIFADVAVTWFSNRGGQGNCRLESPSGEFVAPFGGTVDPTDTDALNHVTGSATVNMHILVTEPASGNFVVVRCANNYYPFDIIGGRLSAISLSEIN